MTDSVSEKPDRRSALQRMLGVAAVPLALPVLGKVLGLDGLPLISSAQAAANIGVGSDQGDIVYVPGSAARTSMVAEWMDPKSAIGPFRIAGNKAAFDKAPPEAARAEAKLYNFPSGSLRTLTYKKGGPVLHLITFETEIFVLSGSATLTPLPGHPGKPVKVSAGDALFLPSGYLSSPKASEDFVILQAFVGRTEREAKSMIVTRKQAVHTESSEWEVDGKEVRATKPDEIKKAPKGAHHLSLLRYVGEGNSIRHATIKGARSGTGTTSRVDVLIYIAKGRVRRKEGNQMLDLVVGDCIREKLGNPGYWEPLEESIFIATDAPMNPGQFPPASI